MVIGKTSSTISKGEIFSEFSETEILSYYFSEINSLPCLINSPLRNDKHPSFSIYLSDKGKVRYIDYATKEKGGLMDLLCAYWNCSFTQALDKICNTFIVGKNIQIKPKNIRTFTRKEKNMLNSLQVVVRSWKQYDYDYWNSYGINPKWLKYAEIYPISHKIVTRRNSPEDKPQRYVFAADKYAYCFVERKEGRLSIKIYQPFNTSGFKWCSKMDGSVVGLWTKIPEKGEKVVICSSLKDALCLWSQTGIPCLCLQGEGYDMSDTAVRELKKRYSKVFICYDTDKAGREDSKKLAERTGFINTFPDFGKEKDISDYYRSLDNKEEFKKLQDLFY